MNQMTGCAMKQRAEDLSISGAAGRRWGVVGDPLVKVASLNPMRHSIGNKCGIEAGQWTQIKTFETGPKE